MKKSMHFISKAYSCSKFEGSNASKYNPGFPRLVIKQYLKLSNIGGLKDSRFCFTYVNQRNCMIK